MYEKIMDLPLFKGVSKDQVSLFLEKTHIMFHNYKAGDVISFPGEEVKMVRFVISGRVSIRHRLDSVGVTVDERSGEGRVLGADRLFGITTGYPFETVATEATSIMEFSKEQYISLLYSDRIYMLNFFNYLSLRAQRPVEAFREYADGDIPGCLRLLVGLLTDPGSEEIRLLGSDAEIARYCGVDVAGYVEWADAAEEKGMVRRTEYGLLIPSRAGMLA